MHVSSNRPEFTTRPFTTASGFKLSQHILCKSLNLTRFPCVEKVIKLDKLQTNPRILINSQHSVIINLNSTNPVIKVLYDFFGVLNQQDPIYSFSHRQLTSVPASNIYPLEEPRGINDFANCSKSYT